METTNRFEVEARTRKALAIVNYLATARGGEGFTHDEVAAFSESQWQLTAKGADQLYPSDQTRALVLSSLRVREQIGRQVEAGAQAERDAEEDTLFSGLGR